MVDGETKPPPLLTEADLIGLMEKHGIGTDATHAEHIETIKNRCYVGVQQDGTFLPGQLGMGLVEGYDLMGFELSKPRLRSELEADLKRICEGTRNKDDVLFEQIAKYKEQFVQAVQEAVKLDQALTPYFGDPQEFIDEVLSSGDERRTEPMRLCPRCKTEQMVLKKTKDGSYMIGCQGYPRCRASIFFPKFVLEASVDESLCQQCQTGDVHRIRFKFKRGSVPPMMPLNYTGCVGGCDETLREMLDLKDLKKLPSESGSSNPTGRGRQNPQPSNRGNKRTPGHGQVGNRAQGVVTRPPTTPQVTRPPAQRGSGFVPNGQSWGQNSGNSASFSGGHNQFPSAGSDNGGDENCVVCSCGQPAMMLTVKKDGPNKGRPFYKCSNRDNGCGFFLWADDDSSGSSSTFGQTAPLRSTSNFNRNSIGFNSDRNWTLPGTSGSSNTQGSGPSCHCSEPAISRTVSKEGANKGRPFYCCAKPRGQGCDFFEWGDTTGSSAAISKFKPGRSASSNSGGARKRRCGLCQQEGHTKRTCPMNR